MQKNGIFWEPSVEKFHKAKTLVLTKMQETYGPGAESMWRICIGMILVEPSDYSAKSRAAVKLSGGK
jgi:hypothetical protein